METMMTMADVAGSFEVWHRVVPTFFDNPDDVLAEFPAGFRHVADVKTPDVGAVFQLTNSIDHGWWENPEVTLTPEVAAHAPFGAVGARSTSVGDVIVAPLAVGFKDGQPVWRRWSVQGIGLREF